MECPNPSCEGDRFTTDTATAMRLELSATLFVRRYFEDAGLSHQPTTKRALAERSIVVMAYKDGAPGLACCSRCSLKFFTPLNLSDDPLSAENYLREKFDNHICKVLPFARKQAS